MAQKVAVASNRVRLLTTYARDLNSTVARPQRPSHSQCDHGISKNWIEPRLSWNPADFGHIEWFYANEDILWTPPLVAYGAHQMQDFRENSQKIAMVNYDGSISSYIPLKFSTVCAMDVGLFPFDIQHCKVRLESPYFYWYEIELKTGIFSGIDSSLLPVLGNSEWVVVNLSTTVELQAFAERDGASEIAIFAVAMSRNSGFYVYMFIVPAYIINGVSLCGIFLTDADRMSRVGLAYGLYILVNLAITLFAVLVATFTPTVARYIKLFILSKGKKPNKFFQFWLREAVFLRLFLLIMETVNSVNFFIFMQYNRSHQL
ncbi:unnamed protein product [Caenorhabditis auriculariae]|uniref:Neurotransmitter-gated ion-channel ligand-binding domain-containing protein n=1 Tax=Caenorhabditis auriculariae TaxID=2777116 RepID=A0A8S1HMK0_9PELO|nr:unnamed protein product [Caenorhabditis auriculariae]